MKKTTYFYHGTTLENAKSLAVRGWNWTREKPQPNWDCSNPRYVYAWCGMEVALIEGEVEDVHDYEVINDEKAIQMAFENAQIAAALQNSAEKALVVLGWKEEYDNGNDEDDEVIPEYFDKTGWTRDLSCSWMDGAYQKEGHLLKYRKPDVIYLCKEGYLPMARSVIIPWSHELLNKDNLSELEISIGEALRRGFEDWEVILGLISPEKWEKISEWDLVHFGK